jgi:hypothetical protein
VKFSRSIIDTLQQWGVPGEKRAKDRDGASIQGIALKGPTDDSETDCFHLPDWLAK